MKCDTGLKWVNAKSKNWYKNDKCSLEGIIIENVRSQFRLLRVIEETTRNLDNSSSGIDLLFTSQANLLIESGVHPSLLSNDHHWLFIQKLTCRFFNPLPYLREVWHYKRCKKWSLSEVLSQSLTGKKLF